MRKEAYGVESSADTSNRPRGRRSQVRLDIIKTHGLGLTLDELAIECCIEDRRVLACEILVDNEALLVGFDADL